MERSNWLKQAVAALHGTSEMTFITLHQIAEATGKLGYCHGREQQSHTQCRGGAKTEGTTVSYCVFNRGSVTAGAGDNTPVKSNVPANTSTVPNQWVSVNGFWKQ